MTTRADLWVLRLGAVPEPLVERILDAGEKARAARFLKPEDRARARQGRSALRLALGRSLGRDPAELRFDQPPGHRPTLMGVSGAPGFSLSHSGSLILLALADGPVGVDVERLRNDDWRGLADRFFHPTEQDWLRTQPVAQQQAGLFRLWTMKEAYLKGLGLGLSRALDGFAVLPEGGAVRDLALPETPWHVRPLAVETGHAAAIAASGSRPVQVVPHDAEDLLRGTVSAPH